ncbi:MAG: polyprenol monophosphomannose synthase [Galactobacter sp.]
MSPVASAERALVVVPTYNELESLPGTVERLRIACPEVDVLIADDNSPDGTGRLADELAAADPRINVLHRAGKEGLGAAYRAGFVWGLERDYDLFVEMDADGSHRPEQLPALLKASREADLVIGSRWVPGGEVVNWPLSRRLISRGGSAFSRTVLGLPVRDITAGFRVYRAGVLKTLDLNRVDSVGYGFQVDMTFRTARAGFRIAEVPISFVERELGVSKMNGGIVQEAAVSVLKWGLTARWQTLRSKLDR